jgi:nitroreductase
MDLDKVVKERHCVRRFKSAKPDYAKILEAIDAARLVPLAGNIPSLKFMLITEKKIINELAEAAAQDFISSAHYVVVVCSNSANCVRSYGDRGELYTLQQAGASIQNFLLKITDLELSTCWVGAFSDRTVKRILKIPDHVRIEGLFPVGKEMGKPRHRTKPSLDSSLYFNTWGNRYIGKVSKPDAG